MSNFFSALGLSAQQIEVLQKKGYDFEKAILDDDVNALLDEFTTTQRSNIERETIAKKKPEFIAEAYNKARKNLIESLGVDDSDFKDEKDFKTATQKAIEKYRELLKSNTSHTDDEIKKELEKFRHDYIESQKTIKALESEKTQIVETSQKEIERQVTMFKVNEQILKLPLREGKEYIIPSEKLINTFNGLSKVDGVTFKTIDGKIEVYKGDEPLKRVMEGSRATEFHTLETYFDEITADFIKKSNGGGGTGGNAGGQRVGGANEHPMAKAMRENAERM